MDLTESIVAHPTTPVHKSKGKSMIYVNVMLVEFYQWASDVKHEILSFDNVTIEELSGVLEQCLKDRRFSQGSSVSILIDYASGTFEEEKPL